MTRNSWISVFQLIRENKVMRDKLTHRFSLRYFQDHIECNQCGKIVQADVTEREAVDTILAQCLKEPAYLQRNYFLWMSRKIKWLSAI